MIFLRKKTPLELWVENRDEFIKIYNSERNKPLTHSKLTQKYTDLNGKNYYGFSKDMMFPGERFGKLKEFLMYIAKGLTASEDEAIDDAMDEALVNGIGVGKNAAVIGALIQERRKRRKFCFHTELFYNYIAVQLVREDEDPETYDNDIQLEKVAQFKEEVKKKDSWSFFQIDEFKGVKDLLKLSEEGWNQYWGESLLQQQLLRETLQVISSQITSPAKEKTMKKV